MPVLSLDPQADRGVLPACWLQATDARLLDEARSHYGACDAGDLKPADLLWTLVIDLPVGILLPLMDGMRGWREWFDDELAMHDADGTGHADAYRALMDEPLDNPVVITVEPARTQIWDGWHRTATRVLGGAATIPAIVGIRRQDGDLCGMLTRLHQEQVSREVCI